jgi:hypothetical protein
VSPSVCRSRAVMYVPGWPQSEEHATDHIVTDRLPTRWFTFLTPSITPILLPTGPTLATIRRCVTIEFE